MNTHERNRCTDATHDWQRSLEESGVEICLWPNCGARREAQAEGPECSVDMVAVERAA